MWRRTVALVNARVVTPHGEARSIRFDTRVLGLDEPPGARDCVLDLDGAVVLPGLINAHDHLELNHYGRLKFRGRYANVSGWIDDMRPRLQADARIRAGLAHSLQDRLFTGVLKNLLAGVTTVAHHNPFYPELESGCPIRVVRRYGWAHSFDLQDAPAGAHGEMGGDVVERHRATPPDVPFFVHVAEGVNGLARAEIARLDQAGCLTANVVLVHGVALDPVDWRRVTRAGAGLVWCPGSNLFLFDRTAPVRQFLESAAGGCRARIALGTDSRLSGRRDLLEELAAAAGTGEASPEELLHMVTGSAADLLREPAAGRLRAGAPADLVILPALAGNPARTLVAATRRDVQLVMVGGRPLLGGPSLEQIFRARRVTPHALDIDGAPKLADAQLVRRIEACAIAEPGVETRTCSSVGAPGLQGPIGAPGLQARGPQRAPRVGVEARGDASSQPERSR